MASPSRSPLQQTYANFVVNVKTTPTPVNVSLDISSMIQSFTLCNPSINTNSVFYGDSGVTASSAGPVIGTGIELLTGTQQTFIIRQERQMYEIQEPVLYIAQKELCTDEVTPYEIPFICWKLSDFYVVATVATSISCMIFRSPFI